MKRWISIPYDERRAVEQKSERLVEFFLKHSKYIVLTRRHEGGIPREFLLEMESEKLVEITERNKRQMEFAKTVSDKELEHIGMNSRKQLAEFERIGIKYTK